VTDRKKSFSERYGYEKVDNSLVWEDLPLPSRNRLWSRIGGFVLVPNDDDTKTFLTRLWDRFYRKEIAELWYTSRPFGGYPKTYFDFEGTIKYVKDFFFNDQWFEVFDFIEFFYEYYPDKKVIDRYIPSLNSVLEEEKLAYRIVNGIVTPQTDKEEIREVEKALNPPDKFAPVREHMRKALKLFSDKREADYQNSIKECMSALDSLVSVIKGKKTTFPNFVRNLDVHKALKDGFLKLYAWSSDAEGIRHGITGEELKPLMAEARYIYVTVSAFVNYVISKYGEGEIKERGKPE